MSEYKSNIEISELAEYLKTIEGKIAVLTHAKPDGDAYGAVVAMTATLQKLGKNATGYFVPPVPANFSELKGGNLVLTLDAPEPVSEADHYILVDTGATTQVGFLNTLLENNPDKLVIIDHHLGGNLDAKYLLVDSNAGSVCEVVWQVISAMTGELGNGELEKAIREGIFVGIASDTGWFKFSNTRPVTYQLAAMLTAAGVDQSALYRLLEQRDRPQKIKLLTRALDSMELLEDDKIAIMKLSIADFKETGALEEETERLVDMPQRIGSVQLVVLISEKEITEEGVTKVICRTSFRSKAGDHPVDVAEVASQFGGGGHARASGAKIPGTIEHVLPDIREALLTAVKQGKI